MTFGARRVSHAATLAYIVVAVTHLLLARRGETLWLFVPMMTVGMCLMSFISANFQSISLQPFAKIAGAAASVMAFVRLLVGALLGTLIGQAYDGTPIPMLTAMVTAGVLALLLVLYSERGRLFRRLNPPSRPLVTS
jgi:DHA1 family bicyclomycin/chloramphenicol resistance-like MFS transporter